jgi:cytochrome bd-type quinol oxidase subunit 2
MVDKIVEPIMFPLLLVGLFWLSERNKNPDHRANREKMRFWVGVAILIACGELAVAWHNEIGSAWQNHPELTFFATLIVLTGFNAVVLPRHRLTALLDDEPLQPAAKKAP